MHGVQYNLYEWNGSKAVGPISMSQSPDTDTYSNTISGIFGDPTSTTYMLVQSGYTGTGATTLKALVLTGASAGSVLDVPNNITVPNNLSFSNTTGGNGDDGSGKSVSGLSSTVKVVLGIFGVLIVIGLAFGIVVRKRRQRKFVVMQEQPSMMLVQTTTGAVVRA